MERPYELIFILKPDVDEDISKVIIQKITDIVKKYKGEISSVDDWGKRKMAYPIQKLNEGRYIFVKLSSPSDTIRKIERLLRVNENVIRYMTVKAVTRKASQPQKEEQKDTSEVLTDEEGLSDK
ncbi:MAG: 30S ribosomal protein S6 [Thermodesulfobacteriota bacterium]